MQAEICARLEDITKYLKPLLPITNCHMVNFITKGMWEAHVPDILKEEVTSVEDQDLNKLFLHYAKYSENEANSELLVLMEKVPQFNNFLKTARDMSLKGSSSLKVLTKHSGLQEKLVALGWDRCENLRMEQFMSYKKMHEVEVMSQLVAALADVSKASHIIDVGGGKGYLSSFLSLYHGLMVLGVDSSQSNTHGAAKRTKKLEKVWNGLCRRADLIKQGCVPPRRGKHWKSQTAEDDSESSDSQKSNSVKAGLYKQVTEFVTPHTDMDRIVEEQFGTEACHNLAIAGLHTCGNLAPSCLQIFTEQDRFSTLSNVGCCYHLMEEKYSRNPFWDDVDPPFPDGTTYGFPMSKFLDSKEFALGRNARMLAAQSLERMGEHHQVQSESLFFRAVLEVLLVQKCGDNVPWGQVGRLTSKCESFSDYVEKAIRKLKLNIKVTPEEIENLYREHRAQQQQLHIFFLMRVSLAPVIEAVILLDRLLYLHEQGIENSYLVQLFDPVISPRCYCIAAMKNV